MKHTLTALLLLLSTGVSAQTDTIKSLNEVAIKGYHNAQPLLRTTASVSVLDSNQIKNQPNSSLLGLINTASGVRMEERSPGSYRLSIRGSLLRSPFGIRNIKIYLDDFPLTDAGGNTYLNAIDPEAIIHVEIYKGPEASVFGANTGGTVLINPILKKGNQLNINTTVGTYGLFHQTVNLNQSFKNYSANVMAGYQQSDGYRDNSALKRKYLQTTQQLAYTKGELKAFLFYSDLAYQTPGGLTATQLLANPKAARPATPTLPGAAQQKAAIDNQTFFAGLSNDYRFNTHLKHVLALFTSHTNFKNPFITNYEKRQENTLGLRSFLEYTANNNPINYHIQGGLESSTTKSDIKNYGNAQGVATQLQAADDLKAHQTFGFLNVNLDIKQRLFIALSSSLNFFGYDYQSDYPTAIPEKQRSFKTRLMPKLAASYLIDSTLTIRASASKGYAPPTLAEVRSSDNLINNDLQAEAGWNYEGGLRYLTKNQVFYADATLFYFNLKDAIVRRLNANDTEYFINAGGTKQLGTEFSMQLRLIKNQAAKFLTGLSFGNSFTYSHFKFNDFNNSGIDYSGNHLTGVPTYNVVSNASFDFPKGFFLFAQHNYTSMIPLNDANTVYAKSYHLVALKTGIRNFKIKQTEWTLTIGVNNLFNKAYSLGNDLNAANNRYFNPSMKRNYDLTLGLIL